MIFITDGQFECTADDPDNSAINDPEILKEIREREIRVVTIAFGYVYAYTGKRLKYYPQTSLIELMLIPCWRFLPKSRTERPTSSEMALTLVTSMTPS